MKVLVDCIVNLGVAIGKDNLKSRKEQNEIREMLQSYIRRQSKINELSNIAEEIDFQGLVNYLNDELLEDVKLRLFGNKSERRMAEDTIIRRAVSYSKANNQMSRKKVVKLVSGVIDILKKYYRKQVKHNTLLMTSEIVDDVESFMKEQLLEHESKVQASVKQVKEELSMKIEEVASNNILSIEKNLNLVRVGNFENIESDLNSFIRCIGSEHILYPDYQYVPEDKDGKLRFISEPISSDAIKKHPPRIECRGKIRLGNEYLNEFNSDTISYANMNQLPITFSILEAKKLLGNIKDPIQCEAEELIGTDVIINPKPFPKAFPCSILIDGNIEFEYILLRTQKILEDGTIILSNTEQKNYPFKIHIKISISMRKTDFNICTENMSNKERLKYVNFMRKVSGGAKIAIRSLDLGKNFIEGNLNPFKCKSDFETVDDEIGFLENIIFIEEYFKKSIALPNEIYLDDYDTIDYMAKLISGKEYKGKWSETSFLFIVSEELKKKIMGIDEVKHYISYVGSVEISLYGEQYKFSIRRTYDKAKIKNLERVKKKAEVLDIGESMKIEYISDSDDGRSSYIDILNTK